MKRIFPIIIMLLLVTLSFGAVNIVSAQQGLDMDMEEMGEIGEFMEFSMWGEEELDDDMSFTMDGYIRVEITGEDKITVEGESYDCLIMSIEGSGDITSDFGLEGSWSMSGKMYGDKATEETVKETSTMTIKMEYEGEKVTVTTEETTIPISKTSTWKGEGDPNIGDEWTITTEVEVESFETIKTSEGTETDHDEDDDIDIEFKEYLRDQTESTKLGSFECRVIKTYEAGDDPTEDYSLDYYCKTDNIPVKSEQYSNGDLGFEMEATAYDVGGKSKGTSTVGPLGAGGEAEEAEGMLGMGKVAGLDTFIIMILAIVIVVILLVLVVAMKRSKQPARPPGYPQQPRPQAPPPPQQAAYPQQPAYQQPPQQPAYQQPPPPPQAPAPSQYSCRTCGGGLEWVEQYRQWYCGYCRQYQ
jgi:hypothetical protein